MTTKKILIAVLLAGICAPALSEELEIGEQVRIVTRSTGGPGLQLEHMLDTSLNGPVLFLGSGKVVKNAPYSAEMVSERTQTLGDGNQIVNKTVSLSYRDSAGRTRTEVRKADGEVVSVAISDPVAGVRYHLRPRDKTATKIATPDLSALTARIQARSAAGEARVAAGAAQAAQAQARTVAEQVRVQVETLRRDGKLADGEHVIIKQVERRAGAAGEPRDVNIRIAKAGALPGAELGLALEDALNKRKSETRDLGTRDFNGVKAQGFERSYEIPAGEIGNRHPIVVSTETWTAPELGVVVYQKRSDPRAGDTVLRLDDLKREEPAAALFSVPSDYTVKDPLAAAAARVEKKQP